MKPQHIPSRAHQLYIKVVIEIFDFITTPFQLVQTVRRYPYHIGELIHTFLCLVEVCFQLVHAV